MDPWILVILFLAGVIMGLVAPFRPKRKVKTGGILYVSPPDEDHKDPYLYLQVTDQEMIFASDEPYATFKIMRRKRE